MTRNRRTPGLSSPISGERQGGHSRPTLARVAKQVLHDPLHPEENQTEMASSGPVLPENWRLGLFRGLFHRLGGVVASRRPHRTTTGDPLRVVLRVQPGGVRP